MRFTTVENLAELRYSGRYMPSLLGIAQERIEQWALALSIGAALIVCPLSAHAATRTISNAGGNWNSTSTWVEGVVPTSADDVVATATSGNVTINVDASARSVDLTGYTNTLTQNAVIILTIGDGTTGANNTALFFPSSGWTYTKGAATSIVFASTSSTRQAITTGGKTLGSVTFNGSGGSWQLQDNLTLDVTFTYTAGTLDTNSKTITLNGNNPAFQGGGQTYYELDLTGSASASISGANTFTNLNRTGTAVKTDILRFFDNQTVTGTLTFAGNSTTNRLLIQSDTLGARRTITNTGATMTWSNVDFRDIGLGTAFNASAITGKSGDAGGNSGITFTTATAQTWSGTSGGNWSANAWTSRVPLPQDDVTINKSFSAGQTITADMPRLGKNISWTGSTGTPSFSLSISNTIYGSLTLISGMVVNQSNPTIFEGRSSFTLTSATKTFTAGVTVQMVGGTLTLSDNVSIAGNLALNNGTFNANGKNVTSSIFSSSNSNTRTVTMGTGTWTLSGTNTAWNTGTATNLTLNANTSTISLTGNGSVTFAGGGKTYNNLTRTGGSSKTNTLSFADSNTFNGTLTLNGNSALNRLFVRSSTPGTVITLTAATVSVTNADFMDITGAGAGSWNLSAITGNSGDAGGNSGITFTTAAAQTWSGTSGGNWSANAWTSRVPLPQDDVVINAAFSASQTVTADMPRLGKSIDWTGTTGSPTFALTSTSNSVYGSLTLIAGMTLTRGQTTVFGGRSAFSLTSAGNILGAVTMQSPGGTITLQDALTASGAITLTAGTLDVSTNNYDIATAGTWVTVHGHFTACNGTVIFNKTSGTQALDSSGSTFYNINHNNNGNFSLQSNNLTVLGSFTNSAGTFDALGRQMAVTGLTTLSGGTYTAGIATQTFNGGLNIQGGTFTGSSGNVTTTNLTLTGGTLTAPSGTFNVSANWLQKNATFTPGTNTVTLNGKNQTMSGSTTFYNLTKTVSSPDTLTFTAGTTQTITNTLTMQGAASNLLTLRSSQTGNQWKIDPQGTRTLGYIDVKDSNNINGTAITTAGNNITDSGNNTNWTFSSGPVSSTTTLASSLNPSTSGSGITLTATVTAGATGTVTFSDGATTLGTCTLSASTCTFSTSSLSVGSHNLSAVYGGDSNYLTSTSNSVTQTVNQATSATAISSGTNPSTYGSSVTFTATVTPSTATGTITVKDGSITLGTCTLSSGSCTYATSGLRAGSHSLTAVYGGNTNYLTSTSSTLTQTVNQAASSTALASGTNPTTFGSGVTLTGTVTPATATGTLTFKDGSTTIGSIAVGHGSGSITISSLGVGSHSLTVVYGGDTNALTSTSNTVSQTVSQAASSTLLQSDSNPSTFNTLILLTAAITPSSATGTITFKDGSTTVGTAMLGHGSGSISISSLSTGSHSLTAVYGGNGNYLASTSSILTQVVAQISPTSTLLISSANPSTYGDSVTFSGVVTPLTATGTLTFKDGFATLGTATLSQGSGFFTLSTLTAGSHSITAVYGGDVNDAGNTSNTLTQTVHKADLTVTLASGTNPATYGIGITLTGTFSSTTATGTLTFKDGTTTLGSATVGYGSGSFAIATLGAGSHSLTAVYGGDSNDNGATSNTVSQTVTLAGSATAFSSDTNPSTAGDSITLTGTVTPSSATGTLTFKDGSITIGTATLGHGSGSLTVSSLLAGSHSLTAVYGGNSDYLTSTSSVLTQAVNQSPSSTVLASSTNPSTFGSSITLTGTVTPSTATGTLTFKDGTTILGTATVGQGSGTVAISTLTAGSHSLTAVYGGDANHLSSTSSAVTQVVNAVSSSSSSASGGNGDSGGGSGGNAPSPGGGRGSSTVQAQKVQEAKQAILARYQSIRQSQQQTAAAKEKQDLAAQERLTAQREELAAKNREDRIQARIAAHEKELAALNEQQQQLQKEYARRREDRLAEMLARQDALIQESEAAKKAEEVALRKEQEANRQRREERLAQEQEEKKRLADQPVATPNAVADKPSISSPEVIAERRGRLFAEIDGSPVIFADVETVAWYAPYVSYLIEENVAQGYKDDTGQPTGEFGVANPITRAEVLKMALEAAGTAPDSSDKRAPANKSARESWAASYVRKAEDLKLTVFLQNPDVNAPATRGEVVQTILEVMQYVIPKTPSTFRDVPTSHPYSAAIGLAAYAGLVQGDTGPDGQPLNTFRPDAPINRAEVSKIIALARQLLKK